MIEHVLGVTGHRKLSNPAAVEQAARRLLFRLEGGARRRWTILSCLARGADRIVARAVLDRPGGTLVAVLPFAVEDYRRDFQDPGDRAEFDALLRLADRAVVLGASYPLFDADDDPSVRATKQALRNEGYRAAGVWIVERCAELVAVWDGRPPGSRGGTADIVAFARQAGRRIHWIDARDPLAAPSCFEPGEGDSRRARDDGQGAD